MALSWLDTLVILFIAAHLVLGFQQGLLMGLVGLVGFAAALGAALIAAPAIAASLRPVTGLPSEVMFLIVAAVLLVLVRLAITWLNLKLHLHLERAPAGYKRTNRWLGILPGGAWGTLSALLLVWLYATVFQQLPPHSPVSKQLLSWGEGPVSRMASRIPTSLPGIAITPTGWELVSGIEVGAPKPPSTLEKEMLALVNQERHKAGVSKLDWDGRLARVAEMRSEDLFKRNYFAHETPDGKTVADVAAKQGVRYLLIGENLAFAPNLAIAHQGLMESPGHRENILRPGFHHVGIGIVRLPAGAHYTPVHDGKAPPMPLRGVGGYLLVTQVFTN